MSASAARHAGADPVPEPGWAPAPGAGVHETVAAALAALVEPDLDGFAPPEIEAAFTEMYGSGPLLRPAYRDWLYQRVRELSFGMTRPAEAEPDESSFRSKDFTASYHRLTGLFSDRIAIVARSRPHVMVVEPR